MTSEPTAQQQQLPDFATYKRTWVDDIEEGNPSSTDKGRRFSRKLLEAWLTLTESDELHTCDGSGDGGIDLAVLRQEAADESGVATNTWYLVQSKYGSAWGGEDTAIREGRKVIGTITGKRKRLSSVTKDVCEKLQEFITNIDAHASNPDVQQNDQIILTFATVDPLSEAEHDALEDIRQPGRGKIGSAFDVQSVSLRTIYDQLIESVHSDDHQYPRIPFRGEFIATGNELLVGVTPLINMYEFLRNYRVATQNIDQLYERNVRRYLGRSVKVNGAMMRTLKEEPEKFGLFNNGITIVVSDVSKAQSGEWILVEPYVVNGCQTTRTIWEVLDKKLGAGNRVEGQTDSWSQKVELGAVVVKIANVGNNSDILRDITTYTNFQNAIQQRDFLALRDEFAPWQEQLIRERAFYMEIQRGGWNSRVALQKQNPKLGEVKQHANAHDLLKVYGAGWLRVPGTAYSRTPPFLPDGGMYEKMMNRDGEKFGADDLYAAYLLHALCGEEGFGRGAKKKKASRSQTKYLFVFGAIFVLRELLRKNSRDYTDHGISHTVIQVMEDTKAKQALVKVVGDVVDRYLDPEEDASVFKEKCFEEDFGRNLNVMLKADAFGRELDKTPNLQKLLEFAIWAMDQSMGNSESIQDILLGAISDLP